MTNFELIVLIVNQGFSEQAMSVARDCGARGGTVLNARGTARGDAETMFNITTFSKCITLYTRYGVWNCYVLQLRTIFKSNIFNCCNIIFTRN